MSKLKIDDLSFCETELLDENRVKGGFLNSSLNRFFNNLFSTVKPLGKPVVEDGYLVQKIYDSETDSSGIEISQESDNSMMRAAVLEGNLDNGSKYQASFATATSWSGEKM